jgi:2-polyprenyl-3-methyl-5-hydroxy-6-metoxy-1,4-benzoquinol methylase
VISSRSDKLLVTDSVPAVRETSQVLLPMVHCFPCITGDGVLDVGCGIGGPLREIALFSGAHITGVDGFSL